MTDFINKYKTLLLASISIFILCCSIQPCYAQSGIKYSKKQKKIFEDEFSKFRLSDGDTLVDIGCGDGINDELLFKFYPNAYFILEDIDTKYWEESKYFIKIGGQKKYFRNRSKRILGTDDSIPLPSEKYKNVLCRITLHEFINPNKMLQEIKRIMSADGQLIIVEQDPRFEGEIEKNCGNKLLSKTEITTLLETNGFTLISADYFTHKGQAANILRFKKIMFFHRT